MLVRPILSALLALELLIANYGGLTRIKNLDRLQHLNGDFFKSFARIYGMSITTFEHKADRYSRFISQAATYGR